MTGRIVLFGATGYTGELTARELAGIGERPVLAARDGARVRALAAELGGLDWEVADVARPESVRALVGAGDVLISTVGPFWRWGAPAVEAAIDGGAALSGLDGRDAVHPAGVRAARAARRGGRRRAADRDGLRLGAGEPGGGRWRCARRAPGPRGWRSATSSAGRSA